MFSTPAVDVPPYQVQALLDTVVETFGYGSMDGASSVDVKCAQALGDDIIAGCSNGEILRFVLQSNGADNAGTYSLYSRQKLPQEKPVDEIVLLPSISRAIIYSDRQLYFYTLPSLDPVPASVIKPIRNVVAFAVDHQQMTRPATSFSDTPIPAEPVDFCVIKRNNIGLYSLLDRLWYHKEIPLLESAFVARRSGAYLCLADREKYGVVNLASGTFTPLMPICQAPGDRIRPMIGVISASEFLILSWTGSSTMGIFVTGDGDPVRGTLEFPQHPQSISVDYPHVAALLPDQTLQILSVDTQTVVQTIPPPPIPENITDPMQMLANERRSVTLSPTGFTVPHAGQAAKLAPRRVKLLGRSARPGGRMSAEITSPIELRDTNGRLMASVQGQGEGGSENESELGHTEPEADVAVDAQDAVSNTGLAERGERDDVEVERGTSDSEDQADVAPTDVAVTGEDE